MQVHHADLRIHDYISIGGAVAQYRLTEIDRLNPDEAATLTRILMAQVGNHDSPAVGYDTAGAAFSGLRILPRLPLSRANLDTVFCSELIAAVLQRLCRMNRNNPARYNPGLLMRQLVRQGTYQIHRNWTGSDAATWIREVAA